MVMRPASLSLSPDTGRRAAGRPDAVVSTVVSSEKSIYNRNSSRSLAARYAERIHTPRRARIMGLYAVSLNVN